MPFACILDTVQCHIVVLARDKLSRTDSTAVSLGTADGGKMRIEGKVNEICHAI